VKGRLVASLALLIVACQTPAQAIPTPSPSASPSAIASPSPRKLADWPQYHRNSVRTGLGPAIPVLDGPRRAWAVNVDADVYASPLIVEKRVIVATENNTVYALDLASGGPVWTRHLGTPVAAATLPCGNIGPVTGITGTPAADAVAGELYVVAFVSGYHHVLFTLSLSDGSVIRQQAIDPGGSLPQVQQERGALTLGSGYVYIPLGGLAGDCGNYHGYVVGVPVGGGATVTYRTPSARESGVWTPMGVTVADDGTVYVATGNGSNSSSFDYSNSVLQLSPDLKLQGYFAPSNWRALDAGDIDLGSVGVALLSSPGVLVSVGKEGVAYLLKIGRLGGIGGQVAAQHVCAGAFGGSAWNGSTLYLPCTDALTAVTVSATGLHTLWRVVQVHMGSPIVAAGAVWAIDVDTATLFAVDPESGASLYSLGLGSAVHFSSPAATQGYVVAPAGSTVVAVATGP
jgi:outer membrane protein assembly factor BamB